MRRLMLLAVSVLAVESMAVSPAFAHYWDGDGWDEVDCVVEDIDHSGVFEEWEVELACGLE